MQVQEPIYKCVRVVVLCPPGVKHGGDARHIDDECTDGLRPHGQYFAESSDVDRVAYLQQYFGLMIHHPWPPFTHLSPVVSCCPLFCINETNYCLLLIFNPLAQCRCQQTLTSQSHFLDGRLSDKRQQ